MSDKPKPRPHRHAGQFDPDLNPRYANIPVEAEGPSGSERTFAVLWEIAKTIGFIVIVAIIIRAFIIQPFFVQGQSMEPDFHEGDYLLVNQFNYHFSKPHRGDVIIFKAPPAPDENYIKRVIGLPGETVELKNGRYYVSNNKHPNPTEVQEAYIEQHGQRPPTQPESDLTRWQLADDQYFVSGDNREPAKSSDSRAWGPVPRANIIGRAWVRVYPLDSFGSVKHVKYTDLATAARLLSAVF